MADPRYLAIANELFDDIRKGRLPVGSTLPSEAEFGTRYRVSRGTVRQALAMLEDAGLLVRKRKSGTRVLSKFPARGTAAGDRIIEDWARYGTDFPLRVSSVKARPLPRDLAREAGYKGRSSWLTVSGLRFPSGARAPIAYCVAFIHPDYAAIRRQITSDPIPLFALIEEKYGRVIGSVRVDLRSVAVDEEAAGPLGVEPGTPALQLIRFFIDKNGRAIEVAVNTHPADRFTYRFEILLSQSGWELSTVPFRPTQRTPERAS